VLIISLEEGMEKSKQVTALLDTLAKKGLGKEGITTILIV